MTTILDLAQILAGIMGRDPASIREHDRLTELGMDSLDRLLLAVLIEERCGVALPDEALADAHTLAELHDRLEPRGEQR